MPFGNASGYENSPNSSNFEKIIGSDGQVYLKVYNHTATAMPNGTPYAVAYKVDATTIDTNNPIIMPILLAPATQAGYNNLIGIVDNAPLEGTTIPAYSYGYVCIQGATTAYVNAVSSIAVGDQLQVINAGTALIPQGSTATSGVGVMIATETCAIAMEAYVTATNALKKVFLTGGSAVIAGS
jgi:hypothetical protein